MPQPRAEAFEHELAERRLRHFIRYAWPNMDPADYVHGWHLDAVSEHLESVADGEIRRLIINVPPRSMKSLAVAVAFPAWVWAQRQRSALTGPRVSFLSTSYAQNLSMRDAVKCRRLLESPWYRRGWGDRFKLTSDQNTKLRYENDQGGVRIASSVDGTATGDGASIIIVDDAISAGDALSGAVRATTNEWFDTTMSTRLNDPRTGAFVIVQQRLHEDDLVGHLLDREDASDWTVLCLPARYEHDHPFVYAKDVRRTHGELLWPERMPEEEVAKLETALGSLAAAGQLQQRPAPRGGGMFQRHWFDVVEVPPAGLTQCRAWDFAATVAKPGTDPDWTVGLKMGKSSDGFYYILGMTRFRDTAAKVEQALLRTAQMDGYSCRISIPQDPGSAGKGLASSLTRLLAGYNVKATRPTGSKETRAQAFAAQAEAGNVKLVRGPWNQAFLDELTVFPAGRHDDITDSASDAFNELTLGSSYNWDAFGGPEDNEEILRWQMMQRMYGGRFQFGY